MVGRIGVAPVHQTRHVLEADVAGLQLLVIQHADAAMADDLVAVEREVHFFDAVAFGAGAELRFGARRAAAEENAVTRIHGRIITSGHRFTGWPRFVQVRTFAARNVSGTRPVLEHLIVKLLDRERSADALLGFFARPPISSLPSMYDVACAGQIDVAVDLRRDVVRRLRGMRQHVIDRLLPCPAAKCACQCRRPAAPPATPAIDEHAQSIEIADEYSFISSASRSA